MMNSSNLSEHGDEHEKDQASHQKSNSKSQLVHVQYNGKPLTAGTKILSTIGLIKDRLIKVQAKIAVQSRHQDSIQVDHDRRGTHYRKEEHELTMRNYSMLMVAIGRKINEISSFFEVYEQNADLIAGQINELREESQRQRRPTGRLDEIVLSPYQSSSEEVQHKHKHTIRAELEQAQTAYLRIFREREQLEADLIKQRKRSLERRNKIGAELQQGQSTRMRIEQLETQLTKQRSRNQDLSERMKELAVRIKQVKEAEMLQAAEVAQQKEKEVAYQQRIEAMLGILERKEQEIAKLTEQTVNRANEVERKITAQQSIQWDSEPIAPLRIPEEDRLSPAEQLTFAAEVERNINFTLAFDAVKKWQTEYPATKFDWKFLVKLTDKKIQAIEDVRKYFKHFSVLQNKLIMIYMKDGRKLGGFFKNRQKDQPQDLGFVFTVDEKNTIRIANFKGKNVMLARKGCGPIYGQEELEINQDGMGFMNLAKMRDSPSFNYDALQLRELSDKTKQSATFEVNGFEIYMTISINS